MASSIRRLIAFGFLIAFFIACGGKSVASGSGGTTTGSGSANGSVGGNSYPIADGFATAGFVTLGSETFYSLGIELTSTAGACAFQDAHHGASRKNTTAVTLGINTPNAAIAPGQYAISASDAVGGAPPLPSASATVESIDAICDQRYVYATGGSVTLTSVDDGAYTGTYTLSFGADSLSGSFSVSSCPPTDGGAPQVGQCF